MPKAFFKKEKTGKKDSKGKEQPSGPTFTPEVGQRLREVSDLFPNQRVAADKAGVALSQWRRYFTGESEPRFSSIADICVSAGIRLEWLWTGEGEKFSVGWDEQPLDEALMQLTIRKCMDYLERQDLRIPPADLAQFLLSMYRIAKQAKAEGKESVALDKAGEIFSFKP